MSDRTFIIAEAGVNHDGSLDRALQMVDAAARAGADAVKFQTFEADKLTTAQAKKADYQIANTSDSGPQQAMLRKLEFSRAQHETLIRRCRQMGIRFMSTAFDGESLAFLGSVGMPAIKIPSGDITAGPLLLQAARLRQPLIVSTGMSTLSEIEEALGVLAFGLTSEREPTGRADFQAAFASDDGQLALRRNVTLLHCVTQYPAPPEAVNLRALDTIGAAFGLPVGYSDHTLGIEISVAAVARGASVIEKHFTLDRSLPGPDHVASIEVGELAQLVQSIRNVERALGSSTKRPAPQEMRNRLATRRSLVAARPIKRGEVFAADALIAKRPGCGVSPMETWSLLGRTAARDYDTDELLEL
jgi:N-acetylneuraminate synthase